MDESPVPPSGLPPTVCKECGRLHRIMVKLNESGTRTIVIWNPEQERYEEILLSRGASQTLINELGGEWHE